MHGFMMLDRDQNGEITLEEMRASKLERWLRADTNNDGIVTRDEVAKLRKNRGARRFTQKDKNNDGLIKRGRGQTLEEKNKRFDHIDANGDGQVTEAEIIEHVDERFKQLDLNGDGIVDRAELQQCRFGRGGPYKHEK